MLTKLSLTPVAALILQKLVYVHLPPNAQMHTYISEVIPTSLMLCTDFLNNIVLMILSAKATLKDTHE